MLANGKQAGKGSITVGVTSIPTFYPNIRRLRMTSLFFTLSGALTTVAVDDCYCWRSPSWCWCVVFLLPLMLWFFFSLFLKITAQELSDNRIITLTLSGRKLDKKVGIRHPTTISTTTPSPPDTHTRTHSECISSAHASGHTSSNIYSNSQCFSVLHLCPAFNNELSCALMRAHILFCWLQTTTMSDRASVAERCLRECCSG